MKELSDRVSCESESLFKELREGQSLEQIRGMIISFPSDKPKESDQPESSKLKSEEPKKPNLGKIFVMPGPQQLISSSPTESTHPSYRELVAFCRSNHVPAVVGIGNADHYKDISKKNPDFCQAFMPGAVTLSPELELTVNPADSMKKVGRVNEFTQTTAATYGVDTYFYLPELMVESSEVNYLISQLVALIRSGKNIVIHCQNGLGASLDLTAILICCLQLKKAEVPTASNVHFSMPKELPQNCDGVLTNFTALIGQRTRKVEFNPDRKRNIYCAVNAFFRQSTVQFADKLPQQFLEFIATARRLTALIEIFRSENNADNSLMEGGLFDVARKGFLEPGTQSDVNLDKLLLTLKRLHICVTIALTSLKKGHPYHQAFVDLATTAYINLSCFITAACKVFKSEKDKQWLALLAVLRDQLDKSPIDWQDEIIDHLEPTFREISPIPLLLFLGQFPDTLNSQANSITGFQLPTDSNVGSWTPIDAAFSNPDSNVQCVALRHCNRGNFNSMSPPVRRSLLDRYKQKLETLSRSTSPEIHQALASLGFKTVKQSTELTAEQLGILRSGIYTRLTRNAPGARAVAARLLTMSPQKPTAVANVAPPRLLQVGAAATFIVGEKEVEIYARWSEKYERLETEQTAPILWTRLYKLLVAIEKSASRLGDKADSKTDHAIDLMASYISQRGELENLCEATHVTGDHQAIVRKELVDRLCHYQTFAEIGDRRDGMRMFFCSVVAQVDPWSTGDSVLLSPNEIFPIDDEELNERWQGMTSICAESSDMLERTKEIEAQIKKQSENGNTAEHVRFFDSFLKLNLTLAELTASDDLIQRARQRLSFYRARCPDPSLISNLIKWRSKETAALYNFIRDSRFDVANAPAAVRS